MKVVYTPRKWNSIMVSASKERYDCEAYTTFREKRKDDLFNVVTEINRRQEEKYHLPQI